MIQRIARLERRDADREQDRPVEARIEGPVLVLDPLEVRPPEQERRVEVKERQPDLTIRVPSRDVAVGDTSQVGELFLCHFARDEAQAGILGDAEVRLVPDEVAVRPEAQGGAAESCWG